MSKQDRDHAMLQAAQLYHIDGLTQAAIADRLGVTRWTVGRLLQEATDQGIVQMTIDHPHARLPQLESALKEKYGLDDVRVVRSQTEPAATYVAVARTAADYISFLRPVPKVVILGWGKLAAGVARALPQGWSPDVQIVQGCTAPHQVEELFARSPVRILASRGPGRARLLAATQPEDSSGPPQVEECSQLNRELFELAAEADVAIVSPIPMTGDSILTQSGVMTEDEVAQLRAAGVVASLLCQLIDSQGNVTASMRPKGGGLPLGQLRETPITIAVGTGTDSAATMAGVLAGRYAKVLILDQEPAESLLNVD